MNVLRKLDDIFGVRAAEITSRASAVSIYLIVEKMYVQGKLDGREEKIGSFYLEFLKELREEVRLGIDATSHFLLSYQSRIIQAADTKTSIEIRQGSLEQAFQYYLDSGIILR